MRKTQSGVALLEALVGILIFSIGILALMGLQAQSIRNTVEAKYRNEGKLQLTTIPAAEWKSVEDEAFKFWDEVAKQSPRSGKVVEIIKKYNESMVKAGAPYRYS